MSFLKTTHYLKSTQIIIDRDLVISHIEICKKPLSKLTMWMVNAISQGELNSKMENENYDTLYHLYMIITTNAGKFILEKNEVITLKKFTSNSKGTDTIDAGPCNIPLKSFLEKSLNDIERLTLDGFSIYIKH